MVGWRPPRDGSKFSATWRRTRTARFVAACQDPFTPDLARRLRSREHRLVLVDDADTLYGAKRAALADLVREPGEAAVVLGASTADGVRDLIRPGDLVLSLDATPALTDAQGGTR